MDRAVLAAYGWQTSKSPLCPQTEEDRAALTACEDEVIDRLYVLNATRAREEARLGRGKKKPTASKRPAKKVSRKSFGVSSTLPGIDDDP